MKTSEEINEIATALSKAQGQMKPADKNRENYFKQKYADLLAVVDAIKKPFADNGLCYTQAAELEEGLISVTTRIVHNSGQWFEAVTKLPAVKNDPQAYGSAYTYAKRYGLMALAGVPSEDDDGQAAQEGKTTKRKVNPIPKEKREFIDKTASDLFRHHENNDIHGAGEVWSELEQKERDWVWLKIPTETQSKLKQMIEAYYQGVNNEY